MHVVGVSGCTTSGCARRAITPHARLSLPFPVTSTVLGTRTLHGTDALHGIRTVRGTDTFLGI
jgi:hypothetical protein